MINALFYRKLQMVSALCLVLWAIFFIPGTAHAGYLDPGSGSTLVQGIIAVMAFWGRIVNRIKSFFRKVV